MTAIKRIGAALLAALVLACCGVLIAGDYLWSECRKAWRNR